MSKSGGGVHHSASPVTAPCACTMVSPMGDSWDLSIERYGTEGEPIVIIDGFVSDPDALRGDAAMLAFAPMGLHYPGIRAEVPSAASRRTLTALEPVAREVFGAAALDLAEGFYSLVTTRPAELAPIQRLPHFDGTDPARLALLLYLSHCSPGGTAFYRHRSSGFETVTEARLPAYRTALESEIDRSGLPAPRYIDGDTALFESIARIDGRYNRAILYRGNRLHCAWLPAGTSFDANAATGRLTMNLFLTAVAEK